MYNVSYLSKLLPTEQSVTWSRAFNKALERFEINPNSVDWLMANILHETNGLHENFLSENLNYTTEESLMRVWPSRFPTKQSATPYVRNPEALANNVYANRMGNGSEATGDGYRFRGRGPLQLTGRSNYQNFTNDTGVDIVSNPDIVSKSPEIGALTAVWFWSTRGLDNVTSFEESVRIINGGYIGLDSRKLWLSKITALKNLIQTYTRIDTTVLHDFTIQDVVNILTSIIKNKPAILRSSRVTHSDLGDYTKVDIRLLND